MVGLTPADKSLFLNRKIKEFAAVALWVDDFIFMHQTDCWTTFIKHVCERFTVPVFGELKTFLGMTINYSPKSRCMLISQANTVQTLLERAGMKDCNPCATPCQANDVWTKKDCPTQTTKYRALIALANFIANWTRPDITYTVNKLCKFMSNLAKRTGRLSNTSSGIEV